MSDASLETRLLALRSGKLDETEQMRLLDDALQEGRPAIAWEVGDLLAYNLLRHGQVEKARQVAERALSLGEDFALRHTLALAEHALGNSAAAIEHLEYALRLLGEPSEAELATLRADMLEHLASFYQKQGKGLRAWQSLEQASQALQKLGDKPGLLRCTQALAKLAETMGDTTLATEKWLDVLNLARQERQSACEAQALLALATLARTEGRLEAELRLQQEAIDALLDAQSWPELAHALFTFGRSQGRRGPVWQSLWLMLALEGPLDGLINAQAWLFMREEQKAMPEAALIAAAVLAVIEKSPRNIPRHAEIQRMAITTFIRCAQLQGVHETAIHAWMENQGLRAEDGILTRALKMIEELEESGPWLFDRQMFLQTKSS